jgi:signal transduction histidine kinase/phage shock protein PspC (stress-responsive transcriptional regulator)
VVPRRAPAVSAEAGSSYEDPHVVLPGHERLPEPAERRMYRRRSGRTLAGVAGGLADHLVIKPLWVRLTFIVLCSMAGAGIVAYGLLWAFVPQRVDDETRPVSARERQQAIGLIALGVAAVIASGTIGGFVNGWVVAAIGGLLLGGAVVWREADESQRRRWRDGAKVGVLGTGGRSGLLRVLTGVVLVLTSISVFLFASSGLGQAQFAAVAVLAALIGVGVLTLPWWLRLVRDLGDERRARIRTEERAEIAAHLHDSVLQTLALIQKQAEAPREVLRLARGQERQLRTWLYGPTGYGHGHTASQGESRQAAPRTLSEAVAAACGEVEDTFAIKVQQVVVGDCDLDERLTALVQATREATVNAAKHAEVSEVSVYAEVEDERVTVFVRDRGKGFDPERVPADRHGLADSIHGRMDRNGGEVRLRSVPGEGTEVQLAMPRTATVA